MKKAECRLCHSRSNTKIFSALNTHGKNVVDKEEIFPVLRCGNCTNVFLGDVEINDRYYKKYYTPGYHDSYLKESRGFLSRIVNWVEKKSFSAKSKFILKNITRNNKKIRILDVGCGSGKFLDSLNGEIYEKSGLEINKEGISTCAKNGLRMYDGDIAGIDFGQEKFDVVTAWHVLEHVEKPVEMLRKIRELLSKGGIFVFTVPNSESFGFRYGKKDWFHLDSPRHLWIPNEKSLEILLKKTGFVVFGKKNEFYDYPLDLFWSVRNYKFKYLIYLFYPIIKLFSNETITFICKKNDQ